jgi:hypothetical protein
MHAAEDVFKEAPIEVLRLERDPDELNGWLKEIG